MSRPNQHFAPPRRHLLATALALLLLVGSGCATSAPAQRTTDGRLAETPAPASAPVQGRSGQPDTPAASRGTGAPLFLWSVQGVEGPRSWLYGSFHLRRASDGTLPEAAVAAYETCDVLVLEIGDLDEAEGAAALLLARHGILDDGQKLQSLLTRELRAQTEAALSEVGMTLAPLSHFRPSVVALMLMMTRATKAGFVTTTGVDRMFFARARDASSPGPAETAGLETAEEQVVALFAMSETMQLATLRDAVRGDLAESVGELDVMLAAYHAGDGEAVVQLTEQAVTRDPEMAAYLERILYERNDRMTARLLPMLMAGRPLFVVVGTAHLVGERSLPDQLREAGYTVTRHADVLPLPPLPGQAAPR